MYRESNDINSIFSMEIFYVVKFDCEFVASEFNVA